MQNGLQRSCILQETEETHTHQIPGACARTSCLYLFVSVLVRRIHERKVFVCEALVKLHL